MKESNLGFAGQISQLGAQNIGNLVWAFTKVLVDDPPPMTATSAAAAAKITACGHQELGNIAWSFAREPSNGAEVLASISRATASSALATIAEWDPQAIANLVQTNATASTSSEPPMTAASLQGVQIITEFTTQNLSNTLQAYATLKVEYTSAGTSEGAGDVDTPQMSVEDVCKALVDEGFKCEEVVPDANALRGSCWKQETGASSPATLKKKATASARQCPRDQPSP
ncbi:unnamed protein product [Symbiodinium pilosum]|uniref:Uncharacterized protein n=1 Tax=Symbiodinium pilosum TaxID=2952 RepID=A0A812IS30_SYMPI|nr:unnamed protein product [Symbiodinium pilosum]